MGKQQKEGRNILTISALLSTNGMNTKPSKDVMMPTGPRGEKRPADVIGAAVMVAKIATGEIEEELEPVKNTQAQREAGKKGGKARAESLTPERRAEIAKSGAEARWGEEDDTIAA